MKKYVINGLFLTQRVTGIQRYAREIIAELDLFVQKDEIIIVIPKNTKEVPVYKNIKIIRHGIFNGILWEQLCLPIFLMKEKADGINLCNVVPLLYPRGIAAIHDISYKVNPQFYTTLRDKISMLWHRLNYLWITHFTNVIITVSNFSKQEIIKNYNVERNRIYVIYSAWQHILRIKATENIFEKYSQLQPKEYFFAMSSIQANKNFPWILKTAKANPQKKFAIAGGGSLKKLSSDLGLKDLSNVFYLGYISDEDAKSLMANCKAFLFPTLYEGFGLPPLEAISCGAGNIIISNTSCMHEIYKEVGYYIDPKNPVINLHQLAKINVNHNKTNILLNKYNWNYSAQIFLRMMRDTSNE